MNASLRTTTSWFERRGEIRLARSRAMVSDRGGGSSHTFHRRMERVFSGEVGGEGGGGIGIWSLFGEGGSRSRCLEIKF
jgi:hypothetical protein